MARLFWRRKFAEILSSWMTRWFFFSPESISHCFFFIRFFLLFWMKKKKKKSEEFVRFRFDKVCLCPHPSVAAAATTTTTVTVTETKATTIESNVCGARYIKWIQHSYYIFQGSFCTCAVAQLQFQIWNARHTWIYRQNKCPMFTCLCVAWLLRW